MTTPQQIADMRAAYDWEQDRIDAWLAEFTGHPGVGSVQIKFQDLWTEYFEEIKRSNQAVLDICDLAIAGTITPNDAARQITRRMHRKVSLRLIMEVVGDQGAQSPYFNSLQSAFDIEEEAREFIETNLT